jgi:hypothetical protein
LLTGGLTVRILLVEGYDRSGSDGLMVGFSDVMSADREFGRRGPADIIFSEKIARIHLQRVEPVRSSRPAAAERTVTVKLGSG